MGHLNLPEIKQSLINMKTDVFSPEQLPRAILRPFKFSTGKFIS